ncbi:MAG: hypothetical protein GYB65_01665, partial [Chloroflexi bacterium]|nr:hypothetical protein [Chloroflexota bacterium]
TVEAADVYYLVDCVGSVGWVVEDRLAGPLGFQVEQLAITVSRGDSPYVTLLDETLMPLADPEPPFAGADVNACRPGNIVEVLRIQAADRDLDGIQEVYYRIECPLTNSFGQLMGKTKGWVTNFDLFGPARIKDTDDANVENRAIIPEGETEFLLELPTDGDVFEEMVTAGEARETVTCSEETPLLAQETRQIGNQIYYRFECTSTEGGLVNGWTDQSAFVGPLLYDPGVSALLSPASFPILTEELPESIREEADALAASLREVPDEEPEEETDDAAAESSAAGDEEETEAAQNVVYFNSPLYLTDNPGIPLDPNKLGEGETGNVVFQCLPNEIGPITEYAGIQSNDPDADTIYYLVSCRGCTPEQAELTYREEGVGNTKRVVVDSLCPGQTQGDDEADDGEESTFDPSSLPAETGWIGQSQLRGPLLFVPGDVTRYRDTSDTILAPDDREDVETPVTYVGIPATIEGAEFPGPNTNYNGRCLLDSEIQITGVLLRENETSSGYTVFYEISCLGEKSVREREPDEIYTITTYQEGVTQPITGLAVAEDLVPLVDLEQAPSAPEQ